VIFKKFIQFCKDAYQGHLTARWNAGLVKKYFPESKYIIEFSFEIAGNKYYSFSDLANIPYERGLMCLALYEQAKMNISREYLERHTEAMDTILNSKTINIYDIKTLNDQIKDRLALQLDVDLLYNLASVAFFDENENPVLYDAEYCKKKIAFWKKHKGVADFFLQKAITDFLPFLRNLNFDLQTYSMLNEYMNMLHFQRISMLNSKN